MKSRINVLTMCAVVAIGGTLSTSSAFADRTTRFSRDNAAGGQTSGVNRFRSGANGGAAAQRRVVRTDGNGNAMVNRGGGFVAPNGAKGVRGSSTVYGADGSVQHKSGMATSGSRGSVTTSGSATKSADGTVTQNRNTNVTNSATGNSYQGSTSYNSETGLSRSGTCYDAGGSEIPCPTR